MAIWKRVSYHLLLHLREGKDCPRALGQQEFDNMGSTVGLLLWMLAPIFHKGFVVILDSGFCVLKAIIELRKKGIFASTLIKSGGGAMSILFRYPEVVHNHFLYCHAVDDHNGKQHSPISLEVVWATKRLLNPGVRPRAGNPEVTGIPQVDYSTSRRQLTSTQAEVAYLITYPITTKPAVITN